MTSVIVTDQPCVRWRSSCRSSGTSGWPPTYHHGAQPAKRMRLRRRHAFVLLRSRRPPIGSAKSNRPTTYPANDQNALVNSLVRGEREELDEVLRQRDVVEQ